MTTCHQTTAHRSLVWLTGLHCVVNDAPFALRLDVQVNGNETKVLMVEKHVGRYIV
jgi:hypothetical protein